ncbi:hypothetical protein IV102_35870, partial [bacterium]|nr:hypothetical protein [bacterium]
MTKPLKTEGGGLNCLPAPKVGWKNWLALMIACGLNAVGSPCRPPDRYFHSPNGRFTLVSGVDGIHLMGPSGPYLWAHTEEYCGQAAVSNDGKLVIGLDGLGWTVYDGNGKLLSSHHCDPNPLRERVCVPGEFDYDQPRSCWTEHGVPYLEFSRSKIFRLENGKWRPVSGQETPSRPQLKEWTAEKTKGWLENRWT